MSAIACKEISKSFGSARVLAGLDLEVRDGAVVTVLGESGSGKTTLLRLIAGFERPGAGTIVIDDEVVDSARRFVAPERRRIGYVAQEGNLFPHLTVAKNVAFGLSRRERTGRVEELLRLVGLGELGGRYPHQLSGGQQQRVALARALAPHPEVVLLDEPFSSLDAGLRSSLRFDVMAILREQRATTVFVTHDQEEALSLADEVAVMRDGRIAQCADPRTLYHDPIDIALARFLGQAILLPATVEHDLARCALGTLTVRPSVRGEHGPAMVMIRPEQIGWAPRSPEVGVDGAHARVLATTYYGHDATLRLSLDGTDAPIEITARTLGHRIPQVGEEVALTVEDSVVAYRN